MSKFKPEYKNGKQETYNAQDIKKYISTKEILYALATSFSEDTGMTCLIHFNDRDREVIIPTNELSYTDKFVTASLIGKFISLVLTSETTASRKKAQQICRDNYINKLIPGDIVNAAIVSTQMYGVFCDIGCGIIALLHCSNVSALKTIDCTKAFEGMYNIKVVIKDNSDGKISLSHKELLGTWQEEVDYIINKQYLVAKVHAIEEYGVFVNITQNLSGLAGPFEDNLEVGDSVVITIHSVTPSKSKVKVSIISKVETNQPAKPYRYYIPESKHLDVWEYNPECEIERRRIRAVFTEKN